MAVSNQASEQGFAPVTQQLSDIQFGEQRGSSGGGNGYLKLGDAGILLSCPVFLPRRKIYAWIFTTVSSAFDNYLDTTVTFYLNGSPVGNAPLFTGNQSNGVNANLSKSMPSAFTNSVQSGVLNTVQDSLIVYPSNPVGTQPASVILQPLYLYGAFDTVKCTINAMRNVTDLRIFICVISSQ